MFLIRNSGAHSAEQKSKRATMILLGVLLLSLAVDAEEYWVEQGTLVTLTCNTKIHEDVAWFYQPGLTDSSYVYVYSNGMVYESHRTRFQVVGSESAGQYRLTISDTHLSDSGIYTCKEEGGLGDSHVFRVNVTSRHTVNNVTPKRDNGSSIAGDSTTQSDPTTVILIVSIVVIVAAIVIIVVVVIVICFRKQRCRHRPVSRDPPSSAARDRHENNNGGASQALLKRIAAEASARTAGGFGSRRDGDGTQLENLGSEGHDTTRNANEPRPASRSSPQRQEIAATLHTTDCEAGFSGDNQKTLESEMENNDVSDPRQQFLTPQKNIGFSGDNQEVADAVENTDVSDQHQELPTHQENIGSPPQTVLHRKTKMCLISQHRTEIANEISFDGKLLQLMKEKDDFDDVDEREIADAGSKEDKADALLEKLRAERPKLDEFLWCLAADGQSVLVNWMESWTQVQSPSRSSMN